MNRLQPLRRLQWRLTLSYILVTVVAALTLLAATAALAAITLRPKSGGEKGFEDKAVVQSIEYNVAPFIVPYLEQNPLDSANLQRRLANMTQPSHDAKGNISYPEPAGRPDLLIVLDRTNHPLATSGAGAAQISGILADAQIRSTIEDAWTGDQNSESLAAHLPDGRSAAASALANYDGQIVGVVLGIYSVPHAKAVAAAAQNATSDAVGAALASLVPGVLLFVVGAGVLGTLTGIFFSRSLTQRLRKITRAARDWSKGEFEVVVHDSTQDEIGQLTQDLNEMAGQLQQLVAARQELAVVEERHRLARDLHDSVKQQLFVVAMLLGTARAQASDAAAVEQTLTEAERLAAHAQHELTALIRALRPVALADKGLSAALAELLADWSQRTGIVVESVVADDLPLGRSAEQELYRVAQEALANVARHSGAASVVVLAELVGETIVLSVADDGHGFDPAAQGDVGLGLGGMRERAESLGGSLHVYSTPAGTRVEAYVPATAGLASAAGLLPAARS